MSHADEESSSIANATLRFPLSGFLIAATVVAIIAAVMGPAYRAVRPGSRATFLAFWSTFLLCGLGYLALHWYRHLRRRHVAGTIRFRLQQANRPNSSFAVILFGWGLFTLTMLNAYAFTSELIRFGGRSTNDAIGAGVMNGLLAIAAVHLLYRPFARANPIRLGDRGLIVGDRPMPWTSVSTVSPNPLHHSQLLLATWHEKPYVAEVPTGLRERVEAFLATRTCLSGGIKKEPPV